MYTDMASELQSVPDPYNGQIRRLVAQPDSHGPKHDVTPSYFQQPHVVKPISFRSILTSPFYFLLISLLPDVDYRDISHS
jgi:hypothetical protein